jgi:histidinol-phosphate aminotransferase
MLTRRQLVRNFGCLAIAGRLASERAFAQQAQLKVTTHDPFVWLDSNENPAGPPASAIKAMIDGVTATARYHVDEFDGFSAAIAQSENVKPEQVLFGVGSTEVIDAAICAFTSASAPLITAAPSYDIAIDLARSLGRKVVQSPLTAAWAYDVRQLAREAANAGGGLIYLCNPNNPTASLTHTRDIDWLAANLPPHTVLLVDEAYIHFSDPTQIESAIKHVRDGKDVIVARTFSKIYGMAGARAGFGCAKPELIQAMNPFMDKVIPILGLRAAMAALGERDTLVPERRSNVARIRGELCGWLQQKKIQYIEPHANFIMIDIRRDAKAFGHEMRKRGVAVGRPFPPLDQMLRVTIGTDEEMKKFRTAFSASLEVGTGGQTESKSLVGTTDVYRTVLPATWTSGGTRYQVG